MSRRIEYNGRIIELPDDFTDEEVAQALSAGETQAPSAPEEPFNPMDYVPNAWALKKAPSLLAIGGGLLGTPLGPAGMVGGAAAGGAAGEALREGAFDRKLSGKNIAMEGGIQGAAELTGLGAAKLAGKVAPTVMRRAMGIGKKITENFPGAAETAVEKGIPVTKRGLQKASALRLDSSKRLMNILNTAKLSGKKFDTRAITKHVRDILADPVLPSKEKDKVLNQLIGFYRDKGLKVDPVLLKGVKQYYQTQSKAAYAAERAGVPKVGRQKFSEAMARGSREQLEQIPGVAAQEAETQSLIGAERAIKDAVQRPPQPFDLHRPGSWPVAGLLAHPNFQSKLAILIGSPEFQAAMRQGPRAAAAMFQQAMLSAEPDVTGQ